MCDFQLPIFFFGFSSIDLGLRINFIIKACVLFLFLQNIDKIPIAVQFHLKNYLS